MNKPELTKENINDIEGVLELAIHWIEAEKRKKKISEKDYTYEIERIERVFLLIK